MTDPFEDELRARLRAMPEPRTSLDAGAIVQAARRRRHPKVAGLVAASVAASVLVLTPVTIGAIQAVQPQVDTASDAGSEAAPEEVESAGGDSDDEAAGCGATPAADAGLSIAFGDDPADGVADVTITNGTAVDVVIDQASIGTATVADDGTVLALPDVPQAEPSILTVPAGESVTLPDASLEPALIVCGEGDGDAAPAVLLADADADGASLLLVGEPWR